MLLTLSNVFCIMPWVFLRYDDVLLEVEDDDFEFDSDLDFDESWSVSVSFSLLIESFDLDFS